MGKPIIKISEYPKFFEDAGFEDVYWQIMKRSTSDWPRDTKMKELGRFSCLKFVEGLEGFMMAAFTRVLGWRPEEVKVLCAQVRAESIKRSIDGWQKGCACVYKTIARRLWRFC